MSEPKPAAEFNLHLSLLSPVFVADEQASVLYPGEDYFYHAGNEEVCYVDATALERELKEAGQWDAFKKESKTRRNRGEERFSLQKFLPGALGGGPDDWEHIVDRSRSARGMKSDNLMPVYLGAQEENKPVLPASLLEKQLYAAMLFDWLKSEKETSGQAELSKIAEGTGPALDASSTFARELGMLREAKRRRPRTLTQHDHDRLRGLETELAALMDHHLRFSSTSLFGDEPLFSMGESLPMDHASLITQATRRLDSEDGRMLEPRYQEVLPAGTDLAIKVNLNRLPSHPHLQGWKSSAIEELTSLMYEYAYEQIEFERDLANFTLEDAKLPGYAQRNIETLKRYYDSLMFDELDVAEDDQAFVWLGTGPDPKFQAIGLAMFQVDPDAFARFRQLGELRYGEDAFPFTRRISVELGAKRGSRYMEDMVSPLGWARVKIS